MGSLCGALSGGEEFPLIQIVNSTGVEVSGLTLRDLPFWVYPDLNFSDGTYRTQNVTVRHNTFRVGVGISVGSESSGGIVDVLIHDNVNGLCEAGHCLGKCCGWGPAMHLKPALTRGQMIDNVVFWDNTIFNNTGVIDMETNYQSRGTLLTGHAPTKVKNIVFTGNRTLGGCTGQRIVHPQHKGRVREHQGDEQHRRKQP